MLLLVRTALERAAITRGDAAETLGTSTEEIRQLLSRPAAGDDDRRLQTILRLPLSPTAIGMAPDRAGRFVG
jgi:hypothetical protein